jgi:hypothetical protein
MKYPHAETLSDEYHGLVVDQKYSSNINNLKQALYQHPIISDFDYPYFFVTVYITIAIALIKRIFFRHKIYRLPLQNNHFFEISVSPNGEIANAYFFPIVDSTHPINVATVVKIRTFIRTILLMENRVLHTFVIVDSFFDLILNRMGFQGVPFKTHLSGRRYELVITNK